MVVELREPEKRRVREENEGRETRRRGTRLHVVEVDRAPDGLIDGRVELTRSSSGEESGKRGVGDEVAEGKNQVSSRALDATPER